MLRLDLNIEGVNSLLKATMELAIRTRYRMAGKALIPFDGNGRL